MAIGASAGGLEALETLFASMPAEPGMAFVVVTHQHPEHTSLLPGLLAKETTMPVEEARDGARLHPNHVYVGLPGGHLAVQGGVLHRIENRTRETLRLPIDSFFRSLAEDLKERAICVVLSGTGTDGTLGMKAVKAESGMAMVQEPQSARYAGMPSSAIATGLADYVLPPESMPQQLLAYARGPYLMGATVAAQSPALPPEPMQKVFLLLRNRTGHDFAGYKGTTIRRRIERRMNVHQIKSPLIYVRYLQDNPHEIDRLFKELLISVTNFFRDAAAWEVLGPYLEELVRSRPENYTLRVWVPGCATGEEAFSLAMLLQECMDRVKRHVDVQIFGTDLDAEAIETARTGQYPDGIAVDVPSRLLERYFLREDGTYRIRKEIREMTIFAQQNVIKDPPFTRLDLLSCRNLLIYLNVDLQKKLLPIFHYSLKPGGLLFLGPSETIGHFTDLYESLEKRWKIYRRREGSRSVHALPDLPTTPAARTEGEIPAEVLLPGKEAHLVTVLERLLLNRFVPPALVVNERGSIFYIHGRTGEFLEPAQGEPRHNVLDMAREGLEIELATAIRECVRRGTDVLRDGVRVRSNGGFSHVDLAVTSIREPEAVRGLLLVTLRPAVPAAAAPIRRGSRKPANEEFIAQLQRELQYSKESHQTILEELETSNEELKSTNEELQSTNEELQSTNEELETSKEEMQSLNEELTTVNAELQSKVDELSQANDDMQNLLNSTDIATVFLDNDLHIKRFTEQARELVMVRTADVGRPIGELSHNLRYDHLASSCREVLRSLVFKEAEVETSDGGCYLMRIMPYRTAENVIDGLVLTFVNIRQLRDTEKAAVTALAYFESIGDTVREPLVMLGPDLRVVSANRSFYRLFRTNAKQTEGELVYELGSGRWDVPRLRELLEQVLPRDSRLEDYEVEVDVPRVGRRVLALNARRLEQPAGAGDLILLAIEDMTSSERRRIPDGAKESRRPPGGGPEAP